MKPTEIRYKGTLVIIPLFCGFVKLHPFFGATNRKVVIFYGKRQTNQQCKMD